MQNKIHSLFKSGIDDIDNLKLTKSPLIIAFMLIYLTILFRQPSLKLSVNTLSGFTIVMFLHLLLVIFSDIIFKKRQWLYFIVNGIICFDYAVIGPKGYEVILVGLIPIFIFQSILIFDKTINILIIAVLYYGLFIFTVFHFSGVVQLFNYLPILILITIAVRAYSIIFLRQVDLRIKTQKILKELEFAYERLEELTLINERQRMARDLHDTLSQGLAGIIMQLEAVDANLKINNVKRAKEIIEKSMEHARKTLADSRLVIEDLRFNPNESIDFAKAAKNEINAFRAVCSASVTEDISVKSELNLSVTKHLLYIIREALNNVAKHAEAENVTIKISEIDNKIIIDIKDDGVGFNISILNRLAGHYGIQGISERVKTIHGNIKLESRKNHGTSLYIIIPIKKGIYDENE